MIAGNSDWLIAPFTPVVIDWRNYFGIRFSSIVFKTALNEHCLVVIAYYWFSRDVTAAMLTYKTLGKRFGNTGIKSFSFACRQ